MKIATWNVNSIRSRLEHVVGWLQANPVDVLCVQETKVVDQDFPLAALADIGYQAHIFGQKSYNGVALISRLPLENVQMGFSPVVGEAGGDAVTARVAGDFDEQKRVITGQFNGVRIVNLYVPNGSEIGSDKYLYKLRWLKVLKHYLDQMLAQESDLLVCGDFNIALEDRDIYDPTKRATHIMSSDAERQALTESVLDLGLADAFRKFNQDDGHFSWWDYRAMAFRRNMGWRIDHHYLSPSLYERAQDCVIDKEPRKLEKPSDHTPVIVELI